MRNEVKEIALVLDGQHTKPLDIILDRPGMALRVIALAVGKNSEKILAPIHIRHVAPNTTSEIFLRSILSGNAVRDGEAVVTIEKGAKGSATRLETRALLLSPKARAKTKPVLEIDENDVKASHAATTGPLDPNALFYLQSRGVNENDAQQLLVWGFLAEGLNRIKDKKTRNEIEVKLLSRLRRDVTP